MTRGMKGCYVYFCDHALAKHFQSLLKPAHIVTKNEIKEEIRIEPTVNENVKYVDFILLKPPVDILEKETLLMNSDGLKWKEWVS